MPDAVTHPTPQELSAFGLGRLPERSAAAVAAHLESCPPCRQAVAAVPPDSFLGKVRAAGPAGSSFPPGLAQPGDAQSIAGRPAMPAVACQTFPPELLRHPKFVILRELGRGGMGVVYQARQKVMNRQVVIKVINNSLLDQPGAVDRFRREVQAAALLSHPNIVTAYDAEQVGELHMLVMEFVPGQSLAEVLEKKGPLSVVNACRYMRQAAAGLQHAHERGMVHRDIKPSNLMLMPKGQVKILDFGLAKVASERGTGKGLTSSGAYMGTPDYSAPEQANDARTADIRADLYSLGCTLYCLLAGRPPFREDTPIKTILAHLQKQPQPLPELRPDVPERLWAVTARLLAKEPGQRFQKPIEVVQALAPFVKQGAKPGAIGGPAPAPGVGSQGKGTRIDARSSQIRRVLRYAPGTAPPRQLPAKDAASSFADLAQRSAVPGKARGARGSTTRRPAAWYRRWPILAGVSVLLLALLGMWAAGLFKVKTADGVLVLQVNEPNAEVFVDGDRVTVTWSDGGKQAEIHVKPGTRKVEVRKDGFSADAEELTFKDGDRDIFTARLLPVQTARANQPPNAKTPSDTAQEKSPLPSDTTTPAVPAAPAPDGFVPLFNGKDLTGWKPNPYWAVENGVLTASKITSSLTTTREDYKDFHLRMEVRLESLKENFTMAIRGGANTNNADYGSYALIFGPVGLGYGGFYREYSVGPGRRQSDQIGSGITLALGEWSILEVIAEGNRLRVIVNGRTIMDVVDDKNASRSGLIQLQVDKQSAEFRKIEIKEFKPQPADGPQVATPLPQEGFAGEWLNVDKDTQGLKRLAISKKGDAWSIEAWGAGGGGALEIPWGHVALSFRAENVGAKSVPYGFATWDPGFAVEELTLRAENEELVVETSTTFKDNSGRRNYRLVERFKKKKPGSTAQPATDSTWLKQVAALPAEKQVEAVSAKLKELNPGFDGKVTPTIEKGVVVGLAFVTDEVKDITPVGALRALQTLNCSGSPPGKGRLADLSPLKDMKLTELYCNFTQVGDLSPLKGMLLTRLSCYGTLVSDLSPLKDMKLTYFNCHTTQVSDLSPLKDMKLTFLNCTFTKVSDVSPLKGMPLTYVGCGANVSDLSPLKNMKSLTTLGCNSTQVSDLSPLKDMKLTELYCDSTQVADLSPLKGMPLTILNCQNAKVSDLTPLKDMPLKYLWCDFKLQRDAAVLRSIPTLEHINDKPAKDVLKDVNAKQPEKEP